MVSLMLGPKLHCGGAIITDLHVLTAGHCITFGYVIITSIETLISNMDISYKTMRIEDGVKHPDFTSNAVRDVNDIAVLKLNQRIHFSDTVRPICLPDSGRNVALTVAGWGKTRQGALTSSRYLLEAKVKIEDSQKCQKSNIYRENLVSDSMMCAYALGKDACQGDSGGPLFSTHPSTNNRKWYQIECGKAAETLISMRIVGGRRAVPHSFPWTVAILKNDRMHCGGAIITNKHLLTAGHCFKDNIKTMKVLLGLDNLDHLQDVEKRNISKIAIHEEFRSTAVRDENDIAVATMDAPVAFSASIDFAGGVGVIVGWGRVGVEKASSKVLLRATLNIQSDEECMTSKLAEHLKPATMMCAFTKGKDGCQCKCFVLGTITFIIGFTGCVGALRENTCLLACLQCCGVEGPKDWDRNAYFNCSSGAVGSREACGQLSERVIHERGCMAAGEDWLQRHFAPAAALLLGPLALKILGICFAQNLRADIFAQKAKWH
ncbi:Serine protease like protein [Operophtera brumata]|uniref:Serine protease like protein n=1 Tax=Operophtera brumata TaxID=104452 RepID=A0A0L7L5B1_OPEBR|nr:Serine protease like protein [Operophtera brumata]